MPLYAYHCKSCGNEFETLMRGSDTPECPTCANTDLTRQLSLIARPGRGAEDAGALACAAACGPSAREAVGCGAPACCMAGALPA